MSELDVDSADNGSVVATVPVKDEGTGEATAKWNGVTDAGDVAPNGKYEFGGGGGDSAAFEQYDHIFPVNGKHTYGDGIGAGRGHQGQDVFADCGTKLVAARAGKVEIVAFHEAAGNYMVIDGKKTDTDYVYMHMQDAPKLNEGDKVKTGERDRPHWRDRQRLRLPSPFRDVGLGLPAGRARRPDSAAQEVGRLVVATRR